jgi:hypothetical protein
MQGGWRADVDDVDIVHSENLVEILNPPFDPELLGYGGEPFVIEVADAEDAELVRVGRIAPDMRAADASANNDDVLDQE